MKILLIDDSALSKKMIMRVIETVDNEIVTVEANGGGAGIALFKAEAPDIVFCDLLMPDMDGIDVVSRIREMSSEAFIVVLSSDAQEERRKEAGLAGVDLFLKKPLDLKKMASCIEQYSDAKK